MFGQVVVVVCCRLGSQQMTIGGLPFGNTNRPGVGTRTKGAAPKRGLRATFAFFRIHTRPTERIPVGP